MSRQYGGDEGSTHERPLEIPWLRPADNPWGVPVLDVRPITLHVTAWSQDRQCAANAVSFAQDDGLGFIGVEPPVSRAIEVSLRYPIDGMLADGVLFRPRQMEHKWALYYHQGQILCIRSWHRRVQAVAEVRAEGDHIEVTALHGAFLDEREEPELTVRVLDYLLRSHALDMVYPAPLPASTPVEPHKAAGWCFSCFGNRALFATPHQLGGGPPERPLRTDSLLHIAVARGDLAATHACLDAGIPVELLARDGLAPLHWALVREGTAMLSLLLERGSPVDVRSAQGATPLMNAVQLRSVEKVVSLLDHGANPSAADDRGFTALHRVAERGWIELVELLLSRGAMPDPGASGHTPRSLAESRGEMDTVRLLDGWRREQ